MKKLALAGLASCFVLALQNVHAGDPAAGRQKSETCLGCHGAAHYVNTYPTYHVPKIAGQHEAYLISALLAYKQKDRPHKTMHANASALNDADIADIAAYFSSIK